MNTPQFKSDKHMFSLYCLIVLLSLEKGAYPENSHMFCVVIKLAFLLTFGVFGSCFRTLADILVLEVFLSHNVNPFSSQIVHTQI